MDAYNFALNIATFVFAFVTTGVTTVIIPAYVNRTDKKAIDSFITIIYSIIIVVVFAILLFRYPLIGILTNRGIEFVELISSFLFIVFITQGITAFLAVTTGYYQSINHYTIPKTIVLLANLIIVIFLLSGKVTDIFTYLLLLVFGSILNLVVDLLIAIKYGFRYAPKLDLHNSELKKMLAIFLPTLISSGVYKIHTMFDTMIATGLAEGQITILSYSIQIITMVNNVVVGNLTVYAYPKIIARIGKKDEKKYFWNFAIFFHAAVILIITGFINIGYDGIKLIFFGGKFTLEDVYMLYICTCIYILGQQFNIVRDLIYRYFYANGDTKETLRNSVIVSILNIILCLIFVQLFDVIGIILGTVFSSLISLCLIISRFKKRYSFGVKIIRVVIECIKNNIAMIVSIVAIFVLKDIFPIQNLIFKISIYGFITIIIFSCTLIFLKTKIKYIEI